MADKTKTKITMGRAEYQHHKGAMSFDDVLAGIADGTIEVPPIEKRDPQTWDEMEEMATLSPFYAALVTRQVTRDQYLQINNAVDKARGVPEAEWIKE